MSSERDINALIAERRKRYLAGEEADVVDEDNHVPGDDDDDTDDENDETSVLVLTDYYGYDDILSDFFRSFYTGEISVNSETYRVTFKLACKYEVSWVISECCEFLEGFLNEKNFIDHFKFLMALKEDRITETTIAKLRSLDYCKLIDHNNIAPGWLNIDIDLLVVLLDHLQPPSEIYVAQLAFSWLEHDLQHRKRKFETIISNLRLVNLPQSFINDVILKFSDVHKVDSTNLYRMVLGTQTYFFSRQMGGPPRRKTLEKFPKVYESRESYVNFEDLEFRVPIRDLQERNFSTNSIRLIYEESSNRYHLAFSRRCCFVYITNDSLIAKYPMSKILIPVESSVDSNDIAGTNFISKEIEIIRDVLSTSTDDRDVNFIGFVAVFLSEDN